MFGRVDWGTILAAACAAACACALGCASSTEREPEFGRPVGRVTDRTAELQGGRDLVAYRTLTREDFRASEAPPEFASQSHRVGAATCGIIEPLDGAGIRVQNDLAHPGQFRAFVVGLRFRAVMDRACSWWNPEPVHSEAYVLEHEQIHFAIFELSARALNQNALAIAARVATRAETPDAAGHEASRRLRRELEAALEETLARSARFDEETSFSHDPERQRAWADRVARELGETADAAAER